jgi:ribosomal protein L3 glutamine methyltransferase
MSLPIFESIEHDLTTIIDWLRFASTTFADASLYYGHGTDNAWDDAAALVVDSLKLPHDHFSTYQTATLTRDERAKLYDAIAQRVNKRVPVPYLTQRAWFMDLPFYVDERVLIPRSPLAEIINQQLEPWVMPEQVTDILELCTGSGCIAVALAKAFPWARVSAVDIDTGAVDVAKRNICDYALADSITLYQGDLFEPIPTGSKFQVIISNPPYVPLAAMTALPEEYQHEPTLALVAGKDGLSCVRTILNEAGNYLTDDGILIVEVGIAEEALTQAYPDVPFTWLEFADGGQGVFLLTAKELKSCM